MTVKSISRFEFDQLLPQGTALESLMVEQVEWYSNRSGNMLAAIAMGEGAAGWNYVILKRDKKGEFHVRKVTNNFFNRNAAKVDLLLSMASIGVDQFKLPALPGWPHRDLDGRHWTGSGPGKVAGGIHFVHG